MYLFEHSGVSGSVVGSGNITISKTKSLCLLSPFREESDGEEIEALPELVCFGCCNKISSAG